MLNVHHLEIRASTAASSARRR